MEIRAADNVIFATEMNCTLTFRPTNRHVSSGDVKLALKGSNSAKLISTAQKIKHLLKFLLELG